MFLKPTYALIGATGYIAPRHFEAIKSIDGELVAVMDHHDVMGKLDDYFPNATLFTDETVFFTYLLAENQGEKPIDYLVVCTPNHLHEKHVLAGLSARSAIICEKPLCLHQAELEKIKEKSDETGLPVYTIMQLRFHEEVLRLKQYVSTQPVEHTFSVNLSYFTPRGSWYDASWKSDSAKSGGILMNIGIHLFDLMALVFGEPTKTEMLRDEHRYAEGFLQSKNAMIHWKLGIDLPGVAGGSVQATQPIRLIEVDGELFDLSVYHPNLHTLSYRSILAGHGFSIEESSKGLNILFTLKSSPTQEIQHRTENHSTSTLNPHHSTQ